MSFPRRRESSEWISFPLALQGQAGYPPLALLGCRDDRENETMKEEMLACFDGDGNPIDPHLRSEALVQPFPDYYHSVSNVFVVNEHLKLLCSLRSEIVSANSLKWQTYFGGHIQAGDSIEEAVLRELKEEIGLDLVTSDLVFISKDLYEPHKHFSYNYLLKFDPERHAIKYEDGEIADTKWMSFAEYEVDRKTHPEKWCNTINMEMCQKISNLLAKI